MCVYTHSCSLCSHLELLPLGDPLFISQPVENLPDAFQLQGSESDPVQDELTTANHFLLGFLLCPISALPGQVSWGCAAARETMASF